MHIMNIYLGVKTREIFIYYNKITLVKLCQPLGFILITPRGVCFKQNVQLHCCKINCITIVIIKSKRFPTALL